MYRLLSFSTSVADIIWWVFNSFSTYPNGALDFYFASSPPLRARVDMHPSPRLFPSLQTPPALQFIVCLRRTTGPINRRVHKCADNTGSSLRNSNSSLRNSNSKRTQLQSHSPAPLRTLLRLPPVRSHLTAVIRSL